MLISGAKNLFRVVTNKIYSPMAKTLSDYFLNPVYNLSHIIKLKMTVVIPLVIQHIIESIISYYHTKIIKTNNEH